MQIQFWIEGTKLLVLIECVTLIYLPHSLVYLLSTLLKWPIVNNSRDLAISELIASILNAFDSCCDERRFVKSSKMQRMTNLHVDFSIPIENLLSIIFFYSIIFDWLGNNFTVKTHCYNKLDCSKYETIPYNRYIYFVWCDSRHPNMYTKNFHCWEESKTNRHLIQYPIYEIKRPTQIIPNLWYCLTYANSYQELSNIQQKVTVYPFRKMKLYRRKNWQKEDKKLKKKNT